MHLSWNYNPGHDLNDDSIIIFAISKIYVVVSYFVLKIEIIGIISSRSKPNHVLSYREGNDQSKSSGNKVKLYLDILKLNKM